MYFAEAVSLWLEKHGQPVWFDLQRLRPGCIWEAELKQGLKGCDLLLLVASRQSLASRWVASEWSNALADGKPVYVLLFEAVDFDRAICDGSKVIELKPLRDHATAIIDGTRNFNKAMDRLLACLSRKTDDSIDRLPTTSFYNLPLHAPFAIWFIAFVMAILVGTLLVLSLTTFTMYLPAVLGGLIVTYLAWQQLLAFLTRESYLGTRICLFAASILLLFLWPYLVPLYMAATVVMFISPDIHRWSPRGEGLTRNGFWRRYIIPTDFSKQDPANLVFRTVYALQDAPIAGVVNEIMTQSGHKHWSRYNIDQTVVVNILIASNWIKANDVEPYIKDGHAIGERWIVIVASQVNNEKLFEPFRHFQWVDYRRQDNRTLKLLAEELCYPHSNRVSYNFSTRTVPTNFQKSLLPHRVSGFLISQILCYSIFIANSVKDLTSVSGATSEQWLVIIYSAIAYIPGLWIMFRVIRREISIARIGFINMIPFSFLLIGNFVYGLAKVTSDPFTHIDLGGTIFNLAIAVVSGALGIFIGIRILRFFLGRWLPDKNTLPRWQLQLVADIPSWKRVATISALILVLSLTVLSGKVYTWDALSLDNPFVLSDEQSIYYGDMVLKLPKGRIDFPNNARMGVVFALQYDRPAVAILKNSPGPLGDWLADLLNKAFGRNMQSEEFNVGEDITKIVPQVAAYDVPLYGRRELITFIGQGENLAQYVALEVYTKELYEEEVVVGCMLQSIEEQIHTNERYKIVHDELGEFNGAQVRDFRVRDTVAGADLWVGIYNRLGKDYILIAQGSTAIVNDYEALIQEIILSVRFKNDNATRVVNGSSFINNSSEIPLEQILQEGEKEGELLTGEIDRWYFYGKACDWESVVVIAGDLGGGEASVLDPIVALYSLDGQFIAYNDDYRTSVDKPFGKYLQEIDPFYVEDMSAVIERIQLPTTGWYEIQVGSYENATSGLYTVDVRKNNPAPS